ncbi:MAG: transpeptidase family protein [Deltaproteobacteria bacterium]|nr:transpeptidase family protein [Deltaproteobacteria bacterium]MBW2133882.1 transpeptidase family protein [Deltaproteobacteria bacterium]
MSSRPGKWLRLRIILVGGFLGLLLLTVTGRFIQLQLFESQRLRELAQREYQKLCPVLSIRGSILDRRGSELAISTFVQSLGAHPGRLPEKGYLSTQLASRLNLPRSQIQKILNKDRPFVWIKRHLTPQQAEAIQAFKEEQHQKSRSAKCSDRATEHQNKSLEAMYLIPEARRFYPHRSLAGAVLGFCNIDGHGLEGLECQFDQYLYGQPIKCMNLLDARGHIIVSNEKELAHQTMGNNLVLALDRTIQYIAEKALVRGVEKWHAAGGLALVVCPQTGEILAMAQAPGFDPNQFYRYTKEQYQNRSLTIAFEPGSTFKIFTVAAALDANAVRPGDQFHCGCGVFKISNCGVIHDVHPYGSLTVSDIIKKSSNIGAAKIGMRMRPTLMDKYLQDFGFGSRTGLCFPGESCGLYRTLKFCRSPIDRITVNFGQGVSLTALQLAMALASLGNDGVLMKPLLVKEILDQQGRVIKQFKPERVRQVVSPQTAHQMLAIMKTVTEPGGTGTEAVPPGYTVAGKTGTAQKLVGGRYSHSKFNALFVGLVPAEQPVLAIVVVIDEPQGAIYGGVVAAPIFREIAARTMRFLGYYPQLEPLVDPSQSCKIVDCSLRFAKPEPEPINGPLKVMPDFRGQTIRQVLKALHRSGLRCRIEGSGVAVTQQPEPGARISSGTICWVKFQPTYQ